MKRGRTPPVAQQTHAPTEQSGGHSTALFWVICAGAYLALGVLYWPSVHFAPISLDDQSLLSDLRDKPFSQVWAYDRFAHLRPAKNLMFWLLAKAPEQLPASRAGVLCVFLLSAAALQRLASRLFGGRYLALAAAVCWGLNPTVPSVVCWLSTANVALCLLAVFAYMLLGERALLPANRSPWWSWVIAAGAGGCWLLALLSHELGLLAPVALFAWLRTRRAKLERRSSVPLITCSVGSIALIIGLYASRVAPSVDYRVAAAPAWLMLGAARYLLENLLLWLWPWGRFGVLLSDAPEQHVLASVLAWSLVAAASSVCWRLRTRDPTAGFAAIWSVMFLVPVINLIPLGVTPVAVHYLYIPGVGLALLLARTAQLLAERVRIAMPGDRLAASLVALCALLWLPLNHQVAAAWGDSAALFAATVRNYPLNIEARVGLSAILLERKQYRAAEVVLGESLVMAPSNVALVRNQFELFWQTGKAAQALALIDASAAFDTPAYAIRRGKLLEQLGRPDEAVAAFQRALDAAVDPKDRFSAGYYLAMALARTEQISAARVLVERLLTEFPGRRELLIAKRLLAQDAGSAPAPNAP